MKEKFEPFKELLKALREIRYAIEGGGKNNDVGEGNDIVLPKYVFVGCQTKRENQGGFSEDMPVETNLITVYEIFEIDYDGKIMNFLKMKQTGELADLSKEDVENMRQYNNNHTINPVHNDYTKILSGDYLYLYTKEQIDIINKNSIVQLYEGTITKFDDNICIDILDMLDTLDTSNMFTELKEVSDYAQRGEYYFIHSKPENVT